jgi:hypothetical protein
MVRKLVPFEGENIIIEGNICNNNSLFYQEMEFNSTITIDVNFLENEYFYKLVVICNEMFNKVDFFCDKKRLKIVSQCFSKYPIEIKYIDNQLIIKFNDNIIENKVKIKVSV